jgi:molybdenum cofactor cytidylyltransferase
VPKANVTAHRFLTGVILAAGASSRMGRPKQLLRIGDRCLLQHVVDAALGSRLDEIILVLGDRAEEIRAGITLPANRPVRIVLNSDYAEGQSTSLRVGLQSVASRAEAAAILLGDQPHVTSQLIDRMVATFLATDRPIVRPLYAGGIPGHPVVLARRIWPEVARLHGDQGARALLRVHPDWLLEVPAEGEPPIDLDTPDDYQQTLTPPAAPAILAPVRTNSDDDNAN